VQLSGGEGVPHVRYLWEVEEATRDFGRREALADCLHTLGWGVDMAYAETSLLEESEYGRLTGERWLPVSGNGRQRNVPQEGSLDDLLTVYERFKARISRSGVDPNTRPSVYGTQAYRREADIVRPAARFALFQPGKGDFLAYDLCDAMKVAAWLRHACAEALAEEHESRDWIDRYVHGHTPDGEPEPRMSFAPLPSIGHMHSDGRIRRALVLEPPNAEGKAVELLELKLTGAVLYGEDGKAACQLGAPEPGDGVFDAYLGRSRVWRSVTPVVLHGHNSLRGAISLHKTERLLRQAFESAGYPERLVEDVVFQAAPFWRGGRAAGQIRVPKHLDGRPRYHVEVRFREAVEGPVLAGIGRHCGIGVFAAWR
jgi:CRISPR-associated protein Csb2